MKLSDPAHPMHDAFFALLAVDQARTAATAPLLALANSFIAKAPLTPPADLSLDEVLHDLAAGVARTTGTADPLAIIALRAAQLYGHAAPHRRRALRDAFLAQMGDVE